MKKKTTKGAKKSKVRDLSAKRAAAGVKGGAGGILSAKSSVQGTSCWIAGVRVGTAE
ncbi:MAG: hypothetical protein ACREM3_15705 [Candidatus Rokuibacteriota bacterium]